jgi:hypothetical protein
LFIHESACPQTKAKVKCNSDFVEGVVRVEKKEVCRWSPTKALMAKRMLVIIALITGVPPLVLQKKLQITAWVSSQEKVTPHIRNRSSFLGQRAGMRLIALYFWSEGRGEHIFFREAV